MITRKCLKFYSESFSGNFLGFRGSGLGLFGLMCISSLPCSASWCWSTGCVAQDPLPVSPCLRLAIERHQLKAEGREKPGIFSPLLLLSKSSGLPYACVLSVAPAPPPGTPPWSGTCGKALGQHPINTSSLGILAVSCYCQSRVPSH